MAVEVTVHLVTWSQRQEVVHEFSDPESARGVPGLEEDLQMKVMKLGS